MLHNIAKLVKCSCSTFNKVIIKYGMCLFASTKYNHNVQISTARNTHTNTMITSCVLLVVVSLTLTTTEARFGGFRYRSTAPAALLEEDPFNSTVFNGKWMLYLFPCINGLCDYVAYVSLSLDFLFFFNFSVRLWCNREWYWTK